ncbi:MAG: PEP-CTERM sorting domain-containing protein, partial [Halioglobus sp.]|nr:PEP-CTERM sorting domain-containing protein [Halioglobus sp.]
ASAIVENGLLSLSNSVATNSMVSVSWDFLTTDLTDGGTNTGLFFNLPSPIDNDLTIGFALNGGSPASQFFADGSMGTGFFIDFSDFMNGEDADEATSLEVAFSSNDPAWDAGFNFIEANNDVPVPASFSLIALGLLGIGISRRKRAG